MHYATDRRRQPLNAVPGQGVFEGLTGRIRVVGRRVPLSLILNQHYFSHTLRIRNRFLRVQLHTHHRRITS